jgi:uncharacterized protein DUF4232
MNDMDDRIRGLLREKADGVPPHLEVPGSLLRRARRRLALNALAAGITVVVVVVGALAGARVLGASDRRITTGRTSPSIRTTPSGPAACTSAQLRAVGSLQGAAGSVEGAIVLTNLSAQPCTVEGRPAVDVLDPNLAPITAGIRFLPSPAAWKVNGSPRPAGWPLVTLAPGDAASVRLRWSNWCPVGRAGPLWRVRIPGGGTVDVVDGMDALPPPPCNGSSQPSTIEVGPFELGTGV